MPGPRASPAAPVHRRSARTSSTPSRPARAGRQAAARSAAGRRTRIRRGWRAWRGGKGGRRSIGAAARAARRRQNPGQWAPAPPRGACPVPCPVTFAEDAAVTAPPDSRLLHPARAARIDAAFEEDVERARIPGAVVAIERGGTLAYLKAFGYRNREKSAAMAPDSIFRIASMTKPMVSVAVMMLAEEGRIRLVNPVSTYLPEMKAAMVGVESADGGAPVLRLEAPRREMTVQDLLRHTSGVTYGQFGDSLVKQAYRAANIMDPNQTTAEFITKLAALPLQYQPGTMWDYGMSTDVLGRLVEVVSGMALDEFIAARITVPLGMIDTGFAVPKEAAHRVAEAMVDPKTGERPPMARDLTVKPRFLSGGGGMVSTVPDYLRFARMLANGGAIDGVHLLSRKTVALMAADHLPPETAVSPAARAQFEESAPLAEFGQGFGLGFCVRTAAGRNPVPGSVGDFYWSGVFGTYFWIDPQEDLVAVLMLCAPEQRRHYRALMRALTYQALAD
ncbi:MAG: beta-lactamase family protein [Burkholderiales bacterium]|nr:beta-lactamase family protein [Burkholderiales bacterium]